MKKVICFLYFVLLNSFIAFSQGYEIKVKIPALKNSTVILAHFFAREGSFFPDDTVKLDKNGVGVFKGSKPLTGGMYIVYLPTKHYFDFLVGSQQKFSIEADTANLATGIKFQGSQENILFYGYRNMTNKGFETEKKWNASSGGQKDSLAMAMKNINQEIASFVAKSAKDYPDSYFTIWVKSLQDVEVPDFPRDANDNVLDSGFRYNYWHKHYFDNFDLSDSRLIRTPFYENKLKYYLEKVIPQHQDSIMPELDMIMGRVKENPEILRYCLGFLFNHFAALANQIVGMDAVYVYFAEKYYLPLATWIDNDFKEKLQKTISRVKPNLIGNIAPDIPLIEVPTAHFIAAQTDTAVKNSLTLGNLLKINQVNSKYTVLVFWDVDCSHCQKDIPFLHDSVYSRIKAKGAMVLAVHQISSIEEKRKWVDFVNSHKMHDWINATPYRADYKNLYNAYTNPTIYVLDVNKRIITKSIGVRQVLDFIDFEERKKKG